MPPAQLAGSLRAAVNDSDMSAFAPKAHLASCALNWGPYYVKAVGDVLDKTWKVENTKWGVKEGLTEFIKVNEDLRRLLVKVQRG